MQLLLNALTLGWTGTGRMRGPATPAAPLEGSAPWDISYKLEVVTNNLCSIVETLPSSQT